MYDDKKKKEEEELSKKDKVSSMMTKDSVKKEDEKEEEKPDMRSKYAMINIIKNKLRAAGQRDPMVMAVDACEEKIDETIIRADGTPTHGAPKRDNAPKNTERTPAKDDPSFDIMRPGGKNSPYNKDGTPKPKVKTKPKDPNIKMPPPHGRRVPKKGTGKANAIPAKGAAKAIGTPPYNPYGKGATATPTNMAPGKP